jgi:hypothetical protein
MAPEENMKRERALLFVPVVALFASCTEPTDPSTRSVDGLSVHFTVTASVREAGAYTARLTVENRRAEDVALVSGCTTLTRIGAFRRGERVHLEGTVDGCFPGETTFRIPSGEDLIRLFEIRAFVPAIGPAPKGEYVLRTDFNVPGLPNVEDRFMVP